MSKLEVTERQRAVLACIIERGDLMRTPTEAEIGAMILRMRVPVEACNCDQAKALQAENVALRARLARLEGGA